MFWKQRNKRIYMDYAATTPLDADVLKAMLPYFTDDFGNANSTHKEGVIAKDALNNARNSVADILNARSEEVIFTSGGTESNNLAIAGMINAFIESGINIKDLHAVTSTIEHPSVLEVFKVFEARGLEVSYVGVDESGVINPKEIKEVIKENTVLVSIMYVNNEIGTIQPIIEIARILRHFRKQKSKLKTRNSETPFFHTDASQASLYLSLNTKKIHADLMTFGGQKIYGPKGSGCLYKRKDVKISSIIKGGDQEDGVRAGTENIPLIVGFAKALELARARKEKESDRLMELCNYFIDELNTKVSQAELNGSRELRSPNNVNIYIPNINGEFFVMILDNKGIACATRSACKEGDEDEGSYVIKALGYSRERVGSSLRFSLGKFTTKNDIDYVIKILSESVEKYSN